MFNFKSLFVLFLFKARFFKLIEEIEESWEKTKTKTKTKHLFTHLTPALFYFVIFDTLVDINCLCMSFVLYNPRLTFKFFGGPGEILSM